MCITNRRGGDEKEEVCMTQLNVHSFTPSIHTRATLTIAFEQGFSCLPTDVGSGYYDYLYIHRSRYETNLSLNWGTE